MEVIYTLCEFEYGYSGTFYQESGGGQLLRFIDMSGNTMNLEPPYGYIVIDDNPPIPEWAK